MKLEEIIEDWRAHPGPAYSHKMFNDTHAALIDISERLQRLEAARGVLIQLLEGLRLTAPTTDVHHAITALLREITADPLEVSQ